MKGKKAVLSKQERNKEPGWEEWVSSIQAAGSRNGDDLVDLHSHSNGATREAISKLAYSYWEGRGFQGGSAEEDWLRAEAEIQTRAIRPRKTKIADSELAQAALV
jgi:hypothetical protein